MEKTIIKKNSKKINSSDIRFKIDKRKCKNCKIGFRGTRYQLWCSSCKNTINNIYWVEYD